MRRDSRDSPLLRLSSRGKPCSYVRWLCASQVLVKPHRIVGATFSTKVRSIGIFHAHLITLCCRQHTGAIAAPSACFWNLGPADDARCKGFATTAASRITQLVESGNRARLLAGRVLLGLHVGCLRALVSVPTRNVTGEPAGTTTYHRITHGACSAGMLSS